MIILHAFNIIRMHKLLLVLVLFHFTANAQHTYKSYVKDNTSYREHALDISHMKVEVSFEPTKGLVMGKVTHKFLVLQQRVDSVFFDGPGITIKSAKLNNAPIVFRSDAKGVWIKPNTSLVWDTKHELVFEYEATPRKGIYFIGWNAQVNNEKNPFAVRKQIWTQGQGIDNRYWIPMYDDMNDKFVTETVITFEKGYEVLSNGLLIKRTVNKNNTETWHYSMSKPHAGYLLMIGIGKYAIKQTKSKRGIPMRLYYYPEFPERAEPTYRFSEMMVDFLEEETGVNYPWETYSQIMVQDFLYGAMENTTATIFGDFFNVDERAFLDRNYVGVNCHELTHQWFGDFITARDGRDTWLQESWATYYPKMLNRKLYGDDVYNWQRRSEHQTAIEAGKKDKFPVRHGSAGTARVYPKGSAVISMLAYVLGDEQWKRALNHYLTKHAYGNVETNDLQQAIQDKLGLDMSWFFDQWIHRPGEPEFTVHYEDLTYQNGNRATEIAVEQTHVKDEVIGNFKMPIVFRVHYTDGTFDEVKDWVDESFEVVKVPNKNKKTIAFVLFDPNSMVLKTLKFKKSFEELKRQLESAPDMLDRYDALVAMRDLPIEDKRGALMNAFAVETFHAMKSEIIQQLITDFNTISQLGTVFNHRDPQPKLTYIKYYQGNDVGVIANFAKALNDSSYDVVQAALEKLYQIDAVNIRMYLNMVKQVYGMANGVNIKYHEIAYMAGIDAEIHLNALIDYTSDKWEFRTRINAFSSIKTSGVYHEVLWTNLCNAMLSTNSRLAGPAADLANYLVLNGTKLKDLKQHISTAKYSPAQLTILKKYISQLP